MRYEIIHDKNVVEPSVIRQMEEILAKQATKLDRYITNYSKPLVLEVHVKKPGPATYLITQLVDMKTKPLVIKNKEDDPIAAFMKGFDAIRHRLIKQMRKERRQYQRNRKMIIAARLEEIAEPLEAVRQEQDPELFTALLKKVLPHLVGYIRRRIRQANMTHTLRKKAMKAEDLVDELYLQLYEHFDEAPTGNPQEFYSWLYRQADLLLKEVIHLEQTNENMAVSVEEWKKKHNKSMEENYSVDADGDYLMSEEFDDPTYHNNDPLFNQGVMELYDFILDDDAQEKMEEQTEFDLMDEEQQLALQRLFLELPDYKRSILDLYIYEQMSIEEIAEVKDVSPPDIGQVLDEVKQLMTKRIASAGN